MTNNSLNFISKSPSQTLHFASQLGPRLKGGEVIELISDIGGGKTTFVKGIVGKAAASPSYVICNEYRLSKLKIYHFDFYRLSDAGTLKRELDEVLSDKKSVVIIEWSNIVKDVLPKERIVINVKALADNKREFTISCPDKFSYLFN